MNSRKRWKNIYPQDNPLALPQAIIREINQCCKSQPTPDVTIDFLWIHLPCAHQDKPELAKRKCLSSDEWLSVIDEAATVGVSSVIISLGNPLHSVLHLVPICEWAQDTYDMIVGIHAVNPLDARDADVLRKLNPEKTKIFVEDMHLESTRFVEDLGISVESTDALLDREDPGVSDAQPTMACIAPDGSIYTCGLVLGDESYCIGHIFERGLGSAVKEEPDSTAPRCSCCPPPMAQKLQSGPEEKPAR